jgi:hypothetical protein
MIMVVTVSERWNHSVTPQSKFGSGNQKPWSAKGGTWRPDPPSVDRYATKILSFRSGCLFYK